MNRHSAAVFLTILLLIPNSRGGEVTNPSVAKGEVDKFLAAIDYAEMVKFPQRWKAEQSEAVQKQIITELLRKMRSTKEIELNNYGDTIIYSRIRAGRLEHPGHGLIERQDFFLESGRSAWAIEIMLQCRLPEFSLYTIRSASVTEENVRQSSYIIIEKMALPAEQKVNK